MDIGQPILEEVLPQQMHLRSRRLLRAGGIMLAFVAGLVLVLFAVDYLLGKHFARHHGKYDIIGPEVYDVAMDRVHRHDANIQTLYFGDSVARQFFYPGHELPKSPARFLTTNQAVSIAGQYYLLRDALVSFPNTRRVFLLYTPRAWANDLDGPLAIDYFCGFFHRPNEIREVFWLKRDAELSAAQTVRWLWPNLMAMNRLSNLRLQSTQAEVCTAPPSPKETGGYVQPPKTGEPLLWLGVDAVDRVWPQQHSQWRATSVPEIIAMSPVSQYYLDKIRQLCKARRVSLKVLPCPCTSDRPWKPSPTPYDAVIWYLPPEDFRDDIHVKWPLVDKVRQELIERYGLVTE